MIDIRVLTAICVSAFLYSAAANDPQLNLFSRTSLQSTVSQSLGGAGTAMPLGGMQGLINPALTASCESSGSIAAGYGRDNVFDKTALPFGVVLTDNNGAMGFYYRFLDGNTGRVHDAAVNFSGSILEESKTQGGVDFGMNVRYEHSVWPYIYEEDDLDDAKLRSSSLLLDIGFYQTSIMTNVDFALVFRNAAGYSWNKVDGEDKTKGRISRRHRTVVAGGVYNLELMGGSLLLLLPLDIEMNHLFTKSLPNKYVLRTGVEGRISSSYTIRFGYAHAPENPMDLITDFNHKNLFFGGVGVFAKPLQLDFFTGKNEWGITAAWFY